MHNVTSRQVTADNDSSQRASSECSQGKMYTTEENHYSATAMFVLAYVHLFYNNHM